MQRNDAFNWLQEHLKDENHIKHSLAVEAIMKGVAARLGEDVEKYGLTGLLHDIDYDTTGDDPAKHSLIGAQMLEDKGFPNEIVYAVKVHNEIHGLERKSMLDKALYCCDPTSGFITAAALVRPDKQLANVGVKSLKKRFKEKAFARGAGREQMSACSEIGLELEEFLTLSLNSMQQIADELGL